MTLSVSLLLALKNAVDLVKNTSCAFSMRVEKRISQCSVLNLSYSAFVSHLTFRLWHGSDSMRLANEAN